MAALKDPKAHYSSTDGPVAIALSKSWTAVIDPQIPLLAPVLGAVVGLLAGSTHHCERRGWNRSRPFAQERKHPNVHLGDGRCCSLPIARCIRSALDRAR